MAGAPLVALDLGKNLGWAVRRTDGSIGSGTFEVETAQRHRAGLKWASFRNHLVEIAHIAGGTPRVYFEASGGVFKSQSAAAAHYGYIAHVEHWAYRSGLWCRRVNQSSVKLHVGGSGKADKPAVAAAAAAFLNLPPCDGQPDEGDARALLVYAIEAEQIGLDEDDEAA